MRATENLGRLTSAQIAESAGHDSNWSLGQANSLGLATSFTRMRSDLR